MSDTAMRTSMVRPTRIGALKAVGDSDKSDNMADYKKNCENDASAVSRGIRHGRGEGADSMRRASVTLWCFGLELSCYELISTRTTPPKKYNG